jgi:hypothetical protein
MSAFAKIGCVVAVAVLLPAQRSNADIMLHTIHDPKDCPDGLIIKSKATDGGMIQFDVYVDSDAIANNELYKGRARAKAVLKIATAQEQIASVVVHGSPEGKGGGRTWYQFTIAPSAAKTSELQLGVSLYEKDGMPTLGGGHSMQIYLVGFQPKNGKEGDATRKEDGQGKLAAKHDFTNLHRLAAALESFNYPDNAATTITVWCQGGGKGTSCQITDAKTLDVATVCYMGVNGHHNKEGLDFENVAIVSANDRAIRFVNVKKEVEAKRPIGLTVERGDLVVVLERVAAK